MSNWDMLWYWATAAAVGWNWNYANLLLWMQKGIRRCGAPNTWGWGNGGCPW